MIEEIVRLDKQPHTFETKIPFISHVINLLFYMMLRYDQSTNTFGVWDNYFFYRLKTGYFKKIREWSEKFCSSDKKMEAIMLLDLIERVEEQMDQFDG